MDASARPAPLWDRLLDGLRAVTARTASDWSHRDLASAALAALASSSAQPAVERLAELAQQFALADLDVDLLAVAALAELEPAGLLLTGLLAGDTGPGRPTPALALEVCGRLPGDPLGRARLAESAPLVRYGLLQLVGSDPLPARRMAVPPRVGAQLTGDVRPDLRVAPLLREPVCVDGPAARAVADALLGGEQLVWVQAAPGAGGTSVASGACARVGVPTLVVDLAAAEPEPSPGSSTNWSELLDAVLLESALSGAVLILAGAERVAHHPAVLWDAAVPVVAVSSSSWQAEWWAELPTTVVAGRPTFADRQRHWSALLGDTMPREVSALRLAPDDIVRVARHAARQSSLAGRDEVAADDIRRSARTLGRGRRAGRGDPVGVTLDDLILPEQTAAEVGRLIDWGRYRDELLALGPLQGKGGKGTGICALLAGGPGTGKTLAAHVVADSLGLDLLQVELPSVVSKYIGETEQNLEKVFDEAESLNAVLFFDEADALFGSRSEVRDARDRYANQEVAYLLQRMEQFDGITVLATNLRGNLDPAFARRLHFVIAFPDPDAATRRRLWDQHIAVLDRPADAEPIDTEGLARSLEIAGGDIRNIVLSAAYAAIAHDVPVGMRHLGPAVAREYAKLGRRLPPASTLPFRPDTFERTPTCAAPAVASNDPHRPHDPNDSRDIDSTLAG